MIDRVHLKVLLKKDFLTLKRNPGFMAAFILVPIVLIGAFIGIQFQVDKGPKSGSLVAENFKYTSTLFTAYTPDQIAPSPFMNVLPAKFDPTGEEPPQIFASSLQKCLSKTSDKYYYSKMMIVAEDEQLRNDAKNYFLNYVFKQNNFPSNWTIDTFASQESAFDDYSTIQQVPYCMGLTFREFDTATDKYKVEFHFEGKAIPDTNVPVFNDLIKTPDLLNYGTWFDSGAPAMYAYITEFIARAKLGSDMSSSDALYDQTVGYAPMQSGEYEDISPSEASLLSSNFPFFFLIIFLIPFYYLTSKIASEKESKSREGMKMMGLTDGTYYLSWFLVFFAIQLVTSVIITIGSTIIFNNVNMFLYFCFCILYSMSIFGQAFAIVAFLPTKRSSGIAASMYHVISYYLVLTIQDPSTPAALKYGLGVLPNVAMGEIIRVIYFYNL